MNLNFFRWWSLKTRVTLFTLAIFLICIWSLCFYASRILRANMQRLLGEQQFATVSLLAADVNHELDERLEVLKTVAGRITPTIQGNSVSLQAFLEERLILQGPFNGGVVAYGPVGTANAAVPITPGRIGLHDPDDEALAAVLRDGKSTIGRPVMDKTLLAPVFAMAVPVRDSRGKLIGALAGLTNLSKLNFLDAITGHRHGKNSYYLLEEHEGRLISAGTDKSRIMQPLPAPGIHSLADRHVPGHEGSGITVNPFGVETLSFAKRIPLAGWFIVTALPTEEAFGPIRLMQHRIMLATILLTLLAGGLTSWMLRRQLSPMLVAAETLVTLSETDEPPEPLPITKQDEVGQLIGGFNRLLETLGNQKTALKESEERFRALVEWTPEPLFVHRGGNLIYVNPAGMKLFGAASAQDLVGKPILDRVHLDFRQTVLARMKDIANHDGVLPMIEERFIKLDGTVIDVEVQASSLTYDGARAVLVGMHDITARKQADDALRESEERYRTVANFTSDWEYWIMPDGTFRYLSLSCEAVSGYSRDEFLTDPELLTRIIHPDDLHLYAEHVHRVTAQGVPEPLDYRIRTKNGEYRWISHVCRPVNDPEGQPLGVRASNRDITGRKQAEEKLHIAASVFTHAREGIMITGADGTIIDVNDTFTHITGFNREEVLGKTPRILNSGRQGEAFYTTMWRDLTVSGHWHGEIWNRRKNGEVYAEMQTISAVRDVQGNARQYVALFSDITALKQHEKQLEYLAHYDALTTLPNRVLLADRLRQDMAQAQRRGQCLAVAYLDLDDFKALNDMHGHAAGDQVLMTLTARMQQCLREGDTLARLGGDEFVAVMLDLADVTASVPMLTRLLAAAAQPVHVGDRVLQISASLGVTFYPQAENIDADQLLRQADHAMYQAKLAGKNRYHVFDPEHDRSVRGLHESLDRIHRALTEGEFVLYYQPKVNMRKGTVIGAEALIRWQHPERGLLPPEVFLPVIEDYPLAVEIGEWAIEAALAQMEIWHAAGLDIPISVNVGARHLQRENFVDRLRALLAAHPDLMPGCLELEVLETSALRDLAGISQVIEACREIGVMFSLDDFGTGYSSLTYLKVLPVTQIKIDRSFVRGMLEQPDDLAILEGVLGLATAFRRQVIAEGVETEEHGEMLLRLGCELGQGFSIARPMPAHELPGWSATWRPDPSWVNCRPISRDDLPLIFASVEHRAWIVAMENHLKGKGGAPPPLDHHQCRFGAWLDAEARSAARPAFQTIEELHRAVHAKAAEMCELHHGGRDPEALAMLGSLHGLRDALLGKLNALVQGDEQ